MKFYALFQKQQIGGALLKRIFAFFLSLLLILGICPMSALADTGGSGNVDGGGGSTILHQLKHAGFNWMDMREIFITHKHIDHLTGIIWMIRVICQNMNSGKYEGEVTIYGHAEVISLLHNLAEQLLPKKQTRFIGDRLHLICVSDAETRTINDRNVTFFDIGSTKAKQFGFSMELSSGKKLVYCGDEP